MCRDGVQKSGEWILAFSGFFVVKIRGSKGLENELTFKYEDFDTAVVKAYLDYMHGIPCENVSNFHLTELLRFLTAEGKKGELNRLLIKKLKYFRDIRLRKGNVLIC